MDQVVTGGKNSADSGRFGHGLGLQLTEWPSLIPDEHTLLVEGMVLTLEPSIETTAEGQLLRSFPLGPEAAQLEVVLNTDGKQLNARVELLNAPNNPKQTFECFTNNGELNSLVVCFECPDSGNTVRIVNLAPVEFPCYVHLNEI